ncbi:hypothetical protein TcasGA2_TC033288 [Tribolium castaneum]|uniref:Uncharacterized protein n=1 Tax=Tribolium castaneum TaxID=7070 RepID=A0A139W8U0_TRICA|nr:hypothetical protein TcasGA2_TC033288 [Tribolium castaneum]
MSENSNFLCPNRNVPDCILQRRDLNLKSRLKPSPK